MLDPIFISRIQFAFTISFHILFPAFSIGLVTFLVFMEAAWLKTKNPEYLRICKFWTKIFALTFGMGVVSGVVMEFQLGTNWSGFTESVGPVLGVLFSYEVLTAFFIEAGFIGVVIFGWNKVGPKLHFLATLLVAIGVTVSAFWIMSANSWMQAPDGIKYLGGHFEVTSWWHVIFNYLVIPRFIHMLLAAYITTAMVIMSVAAYYLLQSKHLDFAKKCLQYTLWALLILMPLQIYMGDVTGVGVHEHQPMKSAAMEAVWDTQYGAPLYLFAIPDQKHQTNHFTIAIPKLASLLNMHDIDGKFVGLKTVKPEDQPDVFIVFWTFRLMVGIGLLMLLIAITGAYLNLKKKLYDSHWFLKICQYSAPLGFIALITGWVTAEVGRQPWVAYNYIRTNIGATQVTWGHIITSFALIFIVYGFIFGYFYFKYLRRTLRKGPPEPEANLKRMPFGYMESDTREGA